jgi:hypothetical protein
MLPVSERPLPRTGYFRLGHGAPIELVRFDGPKKPLGA